MKANSSGDAQRSREEAARRTEELGYAQRVRDFQTHGEAVELDIRTDERVLARVTDGIYRKPGSALRELISNAWDADATRVEIRTDRPRFESIVIEDDGRGMSPETLVRMTQHIGGSLKRTPEGQDFGVANPDDPSLSHGGRPLIGKIGIGLFSVAQLTNEFFVITKQHGDDFRSIAHLVLQQYSEQAFAKATKDGGTYRAGSVRIFTERASDVEAQGTQIVLNRVREQTRDTLRSANAWQAYYSGVGGSASTSPPIDPPRFHVGAVDPASPELLRWIAEGSYESLPWEEHDSPQEAFDKFTRAVWDALKEGVRMPRVSELCDNYLQMIWELSLTPPLPYVQKHPFDLSAADGLIAFKIKKLRQPADEVPLGNKTVRAAAGLGHAVASDPGFTVQIDDLELRRPARFDLFPSMTAALTTPLLFVDQRRVEYTGAELEMSGGPLAFQAYLIWAPKMVPEEHQGVMVRVHNASGTPYDRKFLDYPVAERHRLAQMSCEIFVTEGFDGALNIDRESFNYAHPHVVSVTRWLHGALQTAIRMQKSLGRELREERKAEESQRQTGRLNRVVQELWEEVRADLDDDPPSVTFLRPGRKPAPAEPGVFQLPAQVIIGDVSGPNNAARRRTLERQVTAALQALAAFDIPDDLEDEELHQLLRALTRIIRNGA
jgi:hypothetical protein